MGGISGGERGRGEEVGVLKGRGAWDAESSETFQEIIAIHYSIN